MNFCNGVAFDEKSGFLQPFGLLFLQSLLGIFCPVHFPVSIGGFLLEAKTLGHFSRKILKRNF